MTNLTAQGAPRKLPENAREWTDAESAAFRQGWSFGRKEDIRATPAVSRAEGLEPCKWCCGTGRFSDHECRFCATRWIYAAPVAPAAPSEPSKQTVPWPQVDAYAGGAASGGVAAWLKVRLGDGPEPTEFVLHDLAAEPVPVEAVSEDDLPAWFGVEDEVALTRAVSVMNDVLTAISGWEDRALAEAVEDSKIDLCDMIEFIRMNADASYVPGSKLIDGEAVPMAKTLAVSEDTKRLEQRARQLIARAGGK